MCECICADGPMWGWLGIALGPLGLLKCFLEFTYCRTIEDIGKSTALDFNQKVGPRMLYYHVHISRTLPTPARRPAGRVGAHNELN